VEVGCIADILEEHAASIFMVEVQVEDVVGLYRVFHDFRA
jgi:hypothetical protein